ncbi:MAG: ABC transporter permease [Actinobacteria bacterium]|nr:ABC transporter permease [Actinomycetota bacterium]
MATDSTDPKSPALSDLLGSRLGAVTPAAVGRAVLPYAGIVALLIVGSALIDGFATWPSLRSVLVISAFLGIASIGQTLAIILGGIDLSIPAVVGLANVLTIQLYGNGTSFALVLAIVVGSGLLIGAANGLVSQLLRAHPLIVTLATGSMVGGLTLIIGNGNSIGKVPSWLTNVVSPGGTTFGLEIPAIILVWALFTAGLVFLQRRTGFGRRLYATGSNPEAARLALVRPISVWTGAFAIGGLFAALSGVLLAGFSSGADPTIGDPYLFLTVGSVVVGGTSLLGGSGGYGRTVVGVLAINLLTTILIGEGFSSSNQQFLLGALIIVLVGIAGRQAHVRTQI